MAQTRAAEAELIEQGSSVDELMQRAGRGAAEWVWRLAAGRAVTVLCGPGNNGGDGYVIAQAIRARGGQVAVVAAMPPVTAAAARAAALYEGPIGPSDGEPSGEVLVDCLFGSGLTRPLAAQQAALLARLAARHQHRVAIDMPSGISSDDGRALNPDLPLYDCTLALGAWKPAHFLMPATAQMGSLRLVEIGVAPVAGAASLLQRPHLAAPPPHAHKYTRGLLVVVAGEMAGATLLAARAAQHAGPGYVKLLSDSAPAAPPDLVVETGDPAQRLADPRIAAVLIGPGLGRDAAARARLAAALACAAPLVIDADALMLLTPDLLAQRRHAAILTPHAGEFAALERSFGLTGEGSKLARATALARASGAVVVAKGPDTVIAASDGTLLCAGRASSWLSVSGTGDVLAGTIAARLACGVSPLDAAGEGVWLHGEAARRTPVPFTAGQLAASIAAAFRACL